MTVTALVVTNTTTGTEVEDVDVAQQHFAELPDSVIDALIQKGDVLRSAGGFTVEDPLMAPYLRKRVGTMESST